MPSRALANEGSGTLRRLFTRDVLRIIDHTDGFAQHAQTQADVGILGQAAFVPATNPGDQIPPHKNRVATEGNHAGPCEKMESAFKPEKVLQAVVDAEPVIGEVHELDAGLDDPHSLLDHHRVDHVEDIQVDIILSIKN